MKKLVTVCKLSSMNAKKQPCAILELLGGAVYFQSSSGPELDGKKTVVIFVKAETSAVRKKSVCGRLQVFVSLLAQDETVVHTVKADHPHLLPGIAGSSGFRCDSATFLLEQITQTDGVVENDTVKFQVEFEMRMMTPRFGFPTHPLGHEQASQWEAKFFNQPEAVSDAVVKAGGSASSTSQRLLYFTKVILSRENPVFESLFFGTAPSGVMELDMSCFSCEPIMTLMRHIYFYELLIDRSHIQQTLELAVEYQEIDLIHAIGFLLDTGSVFDVLNFVATKGKDGDNSYLQSISWNVIEKNQNEFLNHPSFLYLEPAAVEWLMRQDRWTVDEIVLWNKCMEWLPQALKRKKQSGKKLMEPILSHIRFSNMTVAEFRSGPADSEHLSKEQVNEFYNHKHSDKEPTLWSAKKRRTM